MINIDGQTCFYSDIVYKNTNGVNKISNRYVQVGFGDDLIYDKNNSNLNEVYKVDSGTTSKFNNDDSILKLRHLTE